MPASSQRAGHDVEADLSPAQRSEALRRRSRWAIAIAAVVTLVPTTLSTRRIVSMLRQITTPWRCASSSRVEGPLRDRRSCKVAQTIDALVTSIREGRDEQAIAMVTALQLPTERDWFRSHFDGELAQALAEEYPRWRPDANLVQQIRRLIAWGPLRIQVVALSRHDSPDATALERDILRHTTSPTTLYSVRLRPPAGFAALHLSSFAFAGTTLRFVGPMRVALEGRFVYFCGYGGRPHLSAFAEIRSRWKRKHEWSWRSTGRLPRDANE